MATGTVPRRRRLLRPQNLLIAVLALVAVLGARMVYRWITATPAPIVDYAAKLESLSNAHQPPGDNGWPLVEAALEAFAESEATILAEDATLSFDHHHLLMDEFPDEGPGPLGLMIGSPERRVVEGLMASRTFDALDDVAAAPRLVRPINATGPLITTLLPSLPQTRRLAVVRAGSMRLAAMTGDAAEQVRAFEHILALGRAEVGQPILIDRLVGLAISALAMRELRTELAEHPIDEATGRALLAAMDRQVRWPPIAMSFEAERTVLHDTIQSCFTDDGHGDGRLDMGKLGGLGLAGGGAAAAAGSVSGFVFAGRAETKAVVDEYFDELVANSRLSRAERTREPAPTRFRGDDFVEELGWRHTFLRLMLPAIAKAQDSDDHCRADAERTRLMIAVETYRAVNDRLPASLDDLVPAILPAPIADPASGGPFVYTRLEAGEAKGVAYDITSTSDVELSPLVGDRTAK